MDTEVKHWMSPVPGFCDTCDAPIHKVFYDAKTDRGLGLVCVELASN